LAIKRIKCPAHTYRNILVYKFQNSCVKLLRVNSFSPINILFHENKVYLLNNTGICPKLLNGPEKHTLSFKNKLITTEHVLQIINNTLAVSFPFTINIYTSYTYLRINSKSLGSNLIGQYLSEEKTVILNIFITPALEGNTICMHKIDLFQEPILEQEYLFGNRPIQEGNKTSFHNDMESEKTLNNFHCICDHSKTEMFFPPRKYENLGNIYLKIHKKLR